VTTTVYGYWNKPVSATDPAGVTATTLYDSLGNQAAATLPAPADSGDLTTVTAYDLLSRPVRVETPSVTQSGTTYTSKTLYEYDPLGNVISQKVQSNAPGQAETYSEIRYGYDEMGRLTGVVSYDGAAIDSAVAYTYDELGNKLTMTTGLSSLTASDGGHGAVRI
jgi:YD repeat-containing protein